MGKKTAEGGGTLPPNSFLLTKFSHIANKPTIRSGIVIRRICYFVRKGIRGCQEALDKLQSYPCRGKLLKVRLSR